MKNYTSLKTSLIIATYNWPKALELVLNSVLLQTVMPDEVIIADDGSTDETKDLVEKFSRNFSVPLIHVWHEDRGFRLSEIRNKAIKRAQFEYIIQIDGDVILHKNFIKDHKNFAEKDCFITGSRVLLSKETSEKALESGKINFSLFSPGVKNRINALYLSKLNSFSRPKNRPMEKMTTRIRGCNMSFWRKDLIAVNGYDEDFIGWGREDSDIVIRLIKNGLFRKKIKFAAIQYHIYHTENAKNNLEENHKLMEQALKSKDFRAKNGIEK